MMLMDILNSSSVMQIVSVLLVVNALLTGASVAVTKLVEIGKLKSDSDIAKTLVSIGAWVSKILDIFSANKKH